jgi:hypothetical protein
MPKLNTYIKKFDRVDIGSMNSRIYIYDRSIAPPLQGGISFTENFVSKLTCWASIETASDETIFDQTNVGSQFGAVERPITHNFYIRGVPAIAVINTPIFSGSGLNDLTTSGTFSGAIRETYLIKIDSVGVTDTFKWSIDNGITWVDENIVITGNAQLLDNGVSIIFSSITGHSLNNYWNILAYPIIRISSQDWIFYQNKFMPDQYCYDVLSVQNFGQEGRFLKLASNLRGAGDVTANYT